MRYFKTLFLALTLTCLQSASAADDPAAAVNSAVAAGKLQEAGRLYKELIGKNPGRADYHLGYARFLRNTGLNSLAIEEYQRSLELKPSQPEALVAMSEISLQNLDLDGAIKYSEAVLKLNPNAREAGMVYATACMQSGRTGEAENEMAVLLAEGKDYDVLHLAYQLKARKGDFKQARECLQEAVAGRPDQLPWMLDLCRLLESSGDYQTSRHYLMNALERNHDSVESRVALARNLEVFENDYDSAIDEYRRALKIDPESPKALAGIDRCQAKKNDLALRLKLGLQSMFGQHNR
ncbi:MAG: tetratricopeptide repeat protein [Candidatus Melainabacteria bacterium]|nr:tetratricopeptide repeat protein [Candidatus Melainabacteria bacterium]